MCQRLLGARVVGIIKSLYSSYHTVAFTFSSYIYIYYRYHIVMCDRYNNGVEHVCGPIFTLFHAIINLVRSFKIGQFRLLIK
jgi:hypothetical protein